MYAIIETGGKQYAVSPGEAIRVEKLAGDIGETIQFEKVLAVSDDDGKLSVGGDTGVTVAGTIAEQGRGKKINVFKFKRRKMYRRHQGHRQAYTEVKIDSINV